MSTENTPTQTAESENTGMTLYCGYGKGITGIRKNHRCREALHLYPADRERRADDQWTGTKKNTMRNRNIEYFTDGAIIRAPQARDRFPSNIVNKADAYILMRKEYDTDSKGQAL
ncbi:hypothetical protein [Mediterraneibacter gnavus]|uniref:hypothetical protein n=1 Tax=Mediterraneibacter gnavus TaxID=33038 RepID=UPI0004631150|nr:hypothetical protein [Mediterraneibacter gnavus]